MTRSHHEHDSFRSLTRYEEYYLHGGDLFFLVDHHVFRVHKYFFERESSYFKGKLAIPASPGSTRQGTSESNAILLDGVRVHEFARFLWVFYNPKYSLYNASVADWVAILTLAHRWSFPEVKALAVRELEKHSMPDIERVVVYQENEVDRSLLVPCYAALCERDEPISPAEGRRLGIDTALTIAQLREMVRRSPIDCRSPTPANFRGNELSSLVRELFDIAAPIREDDSVVPSPLGGPTPPLWLTTPATESLQPPLQSILSHQLPTNSTVQTATPAPSPSPPRMATPPLPAQQVQEPETQLPDPPAPPPVPEKPGRPQVITSALSTQINPPAVANRPSTPAPETPNPEKRKKKKNNKKDKEKEKVVEGTGSAAPKSEEGSSVVVPPPATEESVQQQQQSQEGEKKKDDEPLVDVEKAKDEEAGKTTTTATGVEQKQGADASGTPDAAASTGGEEKAGTVTGGDGVSTDIPSTTTDPAQMIEGKIESKTSPLDAHNSHTPSASPTTRKNANEIYLDFLKSPLDRTKTPSFFSKIGL